MLIFNMTYGRAVPYMCGCGLVGMLAIAVSLLAAKVWWVGAGMLLITVVMAAFIYRTLKNPPVYIIDDTSITLKQLWSQTVYPIDRIVKIQYFDLGIEYSHGPNNARYQLGIYFDRKLFKSVEPRAFCPDDRDGFVNALLALNPDIKVNRTDIRPK